MAYALYTAAIGLSAFLLFLVQPLVHSWIGLKLSLYLTFILATGTIAVFSSEIDWLFKPEMRAQQPVPAEVAWGDAYDTARSSYPGWTVNSLSRFDSDIFSLQVSAKTPWRELRYVWLEPADGTLRGTTGFYSVQRFFRQVHRHLMLPTKIGIPAVTILAFPLIVSLVAGFVVYKKFWRGFFRAPRFERKPRIWLADMHRLAGLWVSWFVLLIALTSVFYFAETLGARAEPFPRPSAVAPRDTPLPEGFAGAQLDAAIERARQTLPGLQVRRVLLPSRADRPIRVQGELSAILVGPRANSVSVDPLTLEVLGHYTGEELPGYTRISESADPLHFGYFVGYLTKVLWFLFGAGMTGLSITGVMIYARRIVRRPRATAAIPQEA